jgi:hypothetical protein
MQVPSHVLGSLGMIVAGTDISEQELNDSDTYDRKAA